MHDSDDLMQKIVEEKANNPASQGLKGLVRSWLGTSQGMTTFNGSTNCRTERARDRGVETFQGFVLGRLMRILRMYMY